MLWIDYAYEPPARRSRRCVELGERPGPDGRPLRRRPAFRDDVAGFHVDAQALTLMGYRGLLEVR